MNKNRFKIVCVALASASMALAGCASLSTHKAELGAPAGLYQKTLFNDYNELAEHAADKGRWDDERMYSSKVLAAHKGGAVTPVNTRDYKLSRRDTGRAAAALTRLKAHMRPDTIDALPAQVAHAQSRYDCWVVAMSHNRKGSAKPVMCEAEWNKAIRTLEDADKNGHAELLPVIQSYEVYFDWNETKLREDSLKTLDQVAQDMKEYAPTDITVTGHADRSGNDDYNVKVSEKRAVTVSKALSERGVSTRVVDEKSSGEADPAVPTADDVKLEANRRVVIEFRK